MADKYVYAIARLINAGLLIWALARHLIGYYTLVRLVTTGVCLYSVYICAKDNRVGWGIAFGGIALLFQPIISLRMTRDTWQYVDVIVAVFLMLSLRFFNRS